MERIVVIFLAGGLGALSRFGLQTLANEIAGKPTLLGTLVVNLSGAFGLGLLMALAEERTSISPLLRSMAAIGFLGAYTTFSTLMFDSFSSLEGGNVTAAVLNLAVSVILGLLCVYLGVTVGRAI